MSQYTIAADVWTVTVRRVKKGPSRVDTPPSPSSVYQT